MPETYESYIAQQWDHLVIECEYHEGHRKHLCDECEKSRD